MLTGQQTIWSENAETVDLKRCHACAAELLDTHKFCRRCGARHPDGYITSTDLAHSSNWQTRPLAGNTGEHASYSSQLIRIVTESLSARTSTKRLNRKSRWLVSTLITIPIWLLIVMLSPLDAYTAAKSAANCLD
jgi:hypothetical protein